MSAVKIDRYTAGGLLLAILLFVRAGPVRAQTDSPGSGTYLRTHIGVSGYLGDVEDPTGETGMFGAPTLSWEFGIPIDRFFTAAAGLQAGNYPRLDPEGTWHTWRFTGHMLLRYTINPSRSFSPYAHVGGHITGGSHPDAPTSRASGPSFGGGLRFAVNRSLQVFAGTNMHVTFPDEAVDGSGSGRPFDLLSSINVGLQFDLTYGSSSLDLTEIEGTDSVRVGEEAVFTIGSPKASTSSVDYTWDFGDGSTASGQTVRHAYQNTGEYTITVKGTSNDRQNSRSRTVIVSRETETPQPRLARACEQALESADTAYRTRRFATALDSLQTCLVEDGIGVEQKVDAHRLRTLIHLKQGEMEAAKNILLQIFSIKPDYQADPVHDPPGYVSLVSIVREQIGSSSSDSSPGAQ